MRPANLEHVVVLARTLSFTRAAHELGMSQSALSRSIQVMERRAGVRLFDRERGGEVHLTAIGRAVAKRATPLVSEMAEINRMLDRSAKGEDGEVAFGMGPLPARALLFSVLAKGLAGSRRMRSEVTIRGAEELVALVVDEKIEFCICGEVPVAKTLPVRGETLGWYPFSLLARAGHPLLRGEKNAGSSSYPVAFASQLSGVPGPKHLHPAYLRPYLDGGPHIVVDDFDTLARLTEATDILWLSSAFAAAAEIREGRLCEVPRPPGHGPWLHRMMFYSLDRRTLSPAASNLKAQFKKQVQALSEMI